MSVKKPLFTMPMPSTGFTKEAQLADSKIIFEYNHQGIYKKGIIEFNGTAAIRKRAERCCTAWHIDEAYDVLVEIEPSVWAEEIETDMDERKKNTWALHHYLIYLDSIGCIEAIADSWKFTTEAL